MVTKAELEAEVSHSFRHPDGSKITYPFGLNGPAFFEIQPGRPKFKRIKSISDEVRSRIQEVRSAHPQWGPERVEAHLRRTRKPDEEMVSKDAVYTLFYPED